MVSARGTLFFLYGLAIGAIEGQTAVQSLVVCAYAFAHAASFLILGFWAFGLSLGWRPPFLRLSVRCDPCSTGAAAVRSLVAGVYVLGKFLFFHFLDPGIFVCEAAASPLSLENRFFFSATWYAFRAKEDKSIICHTRQQLLIFCFGWAQYSLLCAVGSLFPSFNLDPSPHPDEL